jgi:hypothetical protein
MSFSGDIRKFNSKVDKAATAIFRGTSLDLFAHVVRRSPVRTGRFRGNWQAEINKPAKGIKRTLDKSGASAIRSAKNATGKVRLGESVFLVNNLPYSIKLERGSSDQAPRGMVRVTVRAFKRMLARRARKHKV